MELNHANVLSALSELNSTLEGHQNVRPNYDSDLMLYASNKITKGEWAIRKAKYQDSLCKWYRKERELIDARNLLTTLEKGLKHV